MIFCRVVRSWLALSSLRRAMYPPSLRRIAVIASASGNGKTTLAARLGAPHIELDALHHGPGWSAATAEELQARVAPHLEREAWVIDGSYYGKLGTRVLDAAELVVWLDLPRRVWLPRLLMRTIRRVVRRETLWNGNRETLRDAFVGRDALVPYALRSHDASRRELPARLAAYRVERLRTVREVDDFRTRFGL